VETVEFKLRLREARFTVVEGDRSKAGIAPFAGIVDVALTEMISNGNI
jgi:hypothetical protein